MDFQYVWCPNDKEGFILGKYVKMDIGYEGEVTVLPEDPKYPSFKARIDTLYPAEECDREVQDNCALMYLNPAALLNNIRLCYKKNKIYTYVANILLAINPYFDIEDLYSAKCMHNYQGRSLGALPPHVFAIADKALRDMKTLKQSQSIIVSGESGAGKTETTKYILKYLCDLWGSSAGSIEQKLLEANPVLEAFGNAKTTRNNNSSRFGKFMEVHFDNKCQVVGGFISHYLLEKSRICTQAPDERNYHVFYLLCAGAPDSLRTKLSITKPDDFHYLKTGCPQNEKSIETIQNFKTLKQMSNHDETVEFNRLDKALTSLGLDDNDKQNIYTLLAAVLHLGNIAFEEKPTDMNGGCQISSSSENSLKLTAALLGVESDQLRQSLVSRKMLPKRGSDQWSIIMVPLKVHEANNARDALAKAVYSKLFDHIVQCINRSIPFKSSSSYIGVLDIAGFEYFQANSFEQFCINYCNEKLQQFFNERILRDEQDLYEKEQLNVPRVDYTNNDECIDLIELKGVGIFSLLDEESKLPKPSTNHFTREVHNKWTGHFRLGLPRTSTQKVHREVRDDEGFVIQHFAGAVCYQTDQFVDKNNDALHTSLESLIQESSNTFLQAMFATNNASVDQKGKLAFISVGSKFQTQLGELLDKLKSTGTNFIRCIKPNQNMLEHQFDGGSVLSQMESSGMTRVLELMESGYPSRASFIDLHNMYKSSLKGDLSKLNPQMFCKALQEAMGLTSNDYRFGTTKLFFRANMFAVFDSIMKTDAAYLVSMVASVERWYRRVRWRKAQWCALAVIKLKNKILLRANNSAIMQQSGKIDLAQNQHGPGYQGIHRIKILQANLTEMEQTISHLKTDKWSFLTELKKLQSETAEVIITIKAAPNMAPSEVEEMRSQIVPKIHTLYNQLQSKMLEQTNTEEQERLRKIQEERGSRKTGEEEQMNREEEENRYKSELADTVKSSQQYKHELYTWTYGQLRDTVNTSCDIKLLEACRIEFHRRLVVYHAWKAKNRKKTTMNENERAPRSVMDSASKTTRVAVKAPIATSTQRYFRIPFIRPANGSAPNPAAMDAEHSAGNKKGWWYAHFDGEYVARQMEQHPDKQPVLLVAGVDDMQMCELSLDETGLTRRRGTEILDHDFNREWERYGGKPYNRLTDHYFKEPLQ